MSVTTSYILTTPQSEEQGNGFTNGGQSDSDVIGLEGGGYAVAYRNPDGGAGQDFPLFSLRNNNFVQTVAVGIPYNSNGIDMRGAPEMVRLDNGNIAMVWKEGPGAPGGTAASDRVRGAIIDPTTGAVLEPEFTVIDGASYTDPEVAALTNGEWVVAMTDGADVFLQRMSATGGMMGDAIIASVGTDNDPVVVGLKDGKAGFAVAFVNDANGTVHVQTFDADGLRTPDPILVGTGGFNSAPAIAALPNGNFALVYDDTGYGEPGITLQIIDANGTNITPAGSVRVDSPGATIEGNPDVTVLADGHILVTWEQVTSTSNRDVYGRLFSSTGVAVMVDGSTDPFIITNSATNDSNPSVAHIRQGVFVTSWSDSESDESGGRITTAVNEISRSVVGDAASNTMAATAIRDIFDGEGGNDTVSYLSSTSRVQVSLSQGIGRDGDAQNDTYIEVENVIGSTFSDILIGTDYANVLNAGGGGGDQMIGLAGDDLYFVHTTSDKMFEASGDGIDTVRTNANYTLSANLSVEIFATWSDAGTNAINLTGNALGQSLRGNNGTNTLNGGGGVDQMAGLRGNDTYYVHTTTDIVSEAAGQGGDAVLTNVNYTLGAGQSIEAFVTWSDAGTGAINLTGNALAQSLRGNNGVNTLNGGGGGDVMAGLGGSDLYFVHKSTDVVVEAAGQGTDQVRTNVSFALGAGQSIESFMTWNDAGTGAINLTGNDLAQTLIKGNAAANVIDGRGGADILTGLGGSDTFVFSTALGAGNLDRITDFAVGDRIGLKTSIFAAAGPTLTANEFKDLGVVGAVQDADDVILYNRTTGALAYDANGLGAGGVVQFAVLNTKPIINESAFLIIA